MLSNVPHDLVVWPGSGHHSEVPVHVINELGVIKFVSHPDVPEVLSGYVAIFDAV